MQSELPSTEQIFIEAIGLVPMRNPGIMILNDSYLSHSQALYEEELYEFIGSRYSGPIGNGNSTVTGNFVHFGAVNFKFDDNEELAIL